MHAESIAWYALLVFAAAMLFRRTIGVGGMAGLLYAVDLGHAFPAGWIANRNALIAADFGVLAIVAHDRARRDAWRPGAALGPFFFALALAGGESGLGALGFVVAHAFTLDRAPLRERGAAVLPYAIVAVAWQIVYRLLGYGASGSAFYIDPGHAPCAYLEALVTRAPILLAGEVTLLPSEITAALSRGETWGLAAIAMAVCGLFTWALLPILRRDPGARFMALGALFALAPVCATFPSSRLLLFSGIGVCGLLALLFADVAARVERRGAARRAASFARVAHLFVAPCLLPFGVLVPAAAQRLAEQSAPGLPSADAYVGRPIVIALAPNYLVAAFRFGVPNGDARALPGPMRMLAATLAPTEIARVDPYTLEFRAPAGLTGDPTNRLYRDTPMLPGETVTLSDMRATVLEVDESGAPRAVSFRFTTPLDDPARAWIAWEEGRFVPFTPPALGGVVTLR
jgi:hypothetical protein